MLKQTVTTVAAASLLTVALVAQQKPAPSPARPADHTRSRRPPATTCAQEPPRRSARPNRRASPEHQAGDHHHRSGQRSGEPSRRRCRWSWPTDAAGSIRTSGTQISTSTGAQPLSINVDATPTHLARMARSACSSGSNISRAPSRTRRRQASVPLTDVASQRAPCGDPAGREAARHLAGGRRRLRPKDHRRAPRDDREVVTSARRA